MVHTHRVKKHGEGPGAAQRVAGRGRVGRPPIVGRMGVRLLLIQVYIALVSIKYIALAVGPSLDPSWGLLGARTARAVLPVVAFGASDMPEAFPDSPLAQQVRGHREPVLGGGNFGGVQTNRQPI